MSNQKEIFLGHSKSSFINKEVQGEQVILGDERYYKISNVDAMRPFFMSIVSNSNHWMFISSTGGLSAGRKNSDTSLFPYYTDDKITESSEITGSKTLLQLTVADKTYLWEPFSSRFMGVYEISRNLYKNSYGNKIIFEEINHDLDVVFKYEWNSSNLYGFVKRSTLINLSSSSIKVVVLDGIQNIVPYGVEEDLQKASSNLVDAYKKSELDEETGVGIYALSAIIVDKAEPSEALKASLVWSLGVSNPIYLLSSLQLDNFRKGISVKNEVDVKAEKGAYFTCSEFELASNSEKSWMLLANVNQSISDINQIKQSIKTEKNLEQLIVDNVNLGTKNLVQLVSASDGLQMTGDKLRNIRHFSNTLFNIMRGGIFDLNYQIEKPDFVAYMAKANRKVYKKNERTLSELPNLFSLGYLKQLAEKNDDLNFKRLCIEYLPLRFSRRHGDPSRPWNKFSINTRSEIDGSKILDYEGNWRDIFQNWEALAYSYPEFIEGMIHKFLNATTFDGYNPYRVTKEGFDWEKIEPDNPWSYIGYWGDHQIIYLLKFLEIIENHYPNKLLNYFDEDLFVYANVPYRIKSYKEILEDPKNTIEFDEATEDKIQLKREEIGIDGALLRDQNIFICKVNFLEKILATVLAKMSNFIPEGGIWMNTQRPEWNDANNALVGNGVSMVTLYYLRRFLHFMEGLIAKSDFDSTNISEELEEFFNQVNSTLINHKNILSGKISDKDRKTILDGLGFAGSHYRTTIYEKGFTGYKKRISKEALEDFLKVALEFIEHSIVANKRDDELYHAYNLMTIKGNTEVSISHLSEMLEGQVAVLSSGYLSSKESVALLNSLKNSSLFRPDQYSYILYPNKELSRFDVKNNIQNIDFEQSDLLKKLVQDGNNQVITKDCFGQYHFNGSFNNVNSLKEAFKELSDTYKSLIEKDAELIYGIFEKIFNHKSFTGRSGTFFGYEGLGSIYWHMVSKLLLAVQEVSLQAIDKNDDPVLIGNLLDHYFEINEGIGVNKSPKLYGAFPTDPYSHTPAGKGAQQPGMTGQVKEDILSRFGELGVYVKEGVLGFNPVILRKEEFLKETKTFKYSNVNQERCAILLNKESLGFTYCQIPIIYTLSDSEKITVQFTNGSSQDFIGSTLDVLMSKKVFDRTGEIEQINVSVLK